MSIEERVRTIVAAQLKRLPSTLELSMALTTDLGADSLDVTEIVLSLESEFGIDLSAVQESVRTVQDIITQISLASTLPAAAASR